MQPGARVCVRRPGAHLVDELHTWRSGERPEGTVCQSRISGAPEALALRVQRARLRQSRSSCPGKHERLHNADSRHCQAVPPHMASTKAHRRCASCRPAASAASPGAPRRHC
jgi:hypothetical protein